MHGLDPEKVKEVESRGYLVRDASIYREGDSIEQCDEIVGKVPEPYKQFVKDEAAIDTSALPVARDTPNAPNTLKELQEALLKLGIEIPPAAKKADLLALYEQHIQQQNTDNDDHNDQGTE